MKTILILFIFALSSPVFAGLNVITVAKSGGQFSDPVAAINSISSTSKFRRYLIKIEPGLYYLSGRSLLLPSYVRIEGSGQGITTLQSATFSDELSNQACVLGVRNESSIETSIANLTIRNFGRYENSEVACGISNIDAIQNVSIQMKGSAGKMVGAHGVGRMDSAEIIIDNSLGGGLSYGVDGLGRNLRISDSGIYVSARNNGESKGVGISSYEIGVQMTDSIVSSTHTAVDIYLSDADISGVRLQSLNGPVVSIIQHRGFEITNAKVHAQFGDAIQSSDGGITDAIVFNSIVIGSIVTDSESTILCGGVRDELMNPVGC